MKKKYLAKIIAKDNHGLQVVSACCAGAKIKINDVKYLPRSKIFLLSLVRFSRENDKIDLKINSICKFEFVDTVKSKNIDQNNRDLVLELIAIDLLKKNEKYEINLMFSKDACIILSTEIIEVTLEDQNQNLND